MTILKYITTDACPHCGCIDVIREEIPLEYKTRNPIRRHGSREEIREFQCGHTVKCEPNFRRDVEIGYPKCHNTEEFIAGKALKETYEKEINAIKKKYKDLGIDNYY